MELHLEENVRQQDHIETSIQTFRRDREERRERLKRDHVDDRPMRMTRPYKLEDGPQFKKVKHNDRKRIPPGWVGCPSFGRSIDFIVPSKVPLRASFNDLIPPGKRYSFRREVFHQLREKGIKLGMVVDLTNMDRYYSMNELKEEGLKYLKVRCQGRDAVPDNESVNTFVYEVEQFMFNQRDRKHKKYILVHCTHGHNRTGYMIVHYLMRTQQASSVSEAVQIFAAARPPGIYKPDYIDVLYAFYHETKPDVIVCPPTPEWKRSSEIDLNGEALLDDDDGGHYAAATNEKHDNVALMTNDDVLGDKIPDAQEYQLRKFCYEMLKLQPGLRGHTQFPGSHPVSLDRENLQLLRQHYYYATWKADGTRYMLLLFPDGCYLVDRSFKFRRLQMRFPCKKMDEIKFHQGTLLDGEMIIDTVSPQKQVRRYLIYDVIAINSVSVVERPFYERWNMIEKEVVEPRKHEQVMNPHPSPPYRYDLESFRVRMKGFWLLPTAGKLLKEFIPKLSHEADGLIFQGWEDPYVSHTHQGLLKWKYPEMNSVDFLFEIGANGSELLYLHDRRKKRLLVGSRVVFGDGSDPVSFSGKIIECSFDSEENAWML